MNKRTIDNQYLNEIVKKLINSMVNDEDLEAIAKKSMEDFFDQKLKFEVGSIIHKEITIELDHRVKKIFKKQSLKIDEDLLYSFVRDSVKNLNNEMKSRLILELR